MKWELTEPYLREMLKLPWPRVRIDQTNFGWDTSDPILRLLYRIRSINKHGCWITSKPNNAGYGTVKLLGKNIYANRLALSIKLRKNLADMKLACHNCPGGDNPACANPDHLFEGSYMDNSRDAYSKGQIRYHIRRDWHPNSKLTTQDVARIRAAALQGCTHKRIANVFKVSESNIDHIISGRAWRDVLPCKLRDSDELHDAIFSSKDFTPDRKGEKCPSAKLLEKNVREILALLADGLTCRSISQKFNISISAIKAIKSRKNWKHVRLPPS